MTSVTARRTRLATRRGIVRQIIRAFLKHRELRRHRMHLYSLSDDILRDIGIARHDIDRAIRRPRS